MSRLLTTKEISFMTKKESFNIPSNQLLYKEQLTQQWFVDVLNLNGSTWDFSPLENNELPIIKGINEQPKIKIEDLIK